MRAFNPWRKIESAPGNKMVEVCGDSGYSIHRWFVINAYFCPDKLAWLDATGTRLTDTGWAPIYWRYESAFPTVDPRNGTVEDLP